LLLEPTHTRTLKDLNSAASVPLCGPGYLESIPSYPFYKVCDKIIIIIIITIRDNEKGICMLIDVAISGETEM
jgi:hypothetical protein